MSTEKADFIFDKSTQPTFKIVSTLLGNATKLWSEFLEFIESEAGATVPEWKY